MKPTAVLFDFDGVIVDSYDCHKQAWSEAHLKTLGVDLPECDHSQLTGKPSPVIAEFLASEAGQSEKTDELYATKMELLLSSTNTPKLLTGVFEVFSLLTKQNIPYAIISNAPRAYLAQTITALELGDIPYLGFEDYEQAKPSGDPYLKGAEKLGLPVKDHGKIFVFEDSVIGVLSATDAGMIPLGIGTSAAGACLSEEGAIRIFPSLLETLDCRVYA